jgi:hypothetical protein
LERRSRLTQATNKVQQAPTPTRITDNPPLTSIYDGDPPLEQTQGFQPVVALNLVRRDQGPVGGMSRRSRVVGCRDGLGSDYGLDAVRADDDVSFDRLTGSEGDEAGSGVLHVPPYEDDIPKPNRYERSTFHRKYL